MRQPATISAVSVPGRLLPAPVRGILWKDYLLLRRDLRNLSQLITPLIFGIVYTIMFLRPDSELISGAGDAPAWFTEITRIVVTYGNIGMALFVGWMLLARLAGMAFSSEGKNYWIMKSSPLRASHMLLAKFLVAYLPTLGLGSIFIVGVSILQKTPLIGFFYSLVATALCLAGMDGILLSFGVAGANFKWDDPRKMGSGSLGCLGQLLTMLFLPVAFGLFVGPLILVSVFNWPLASGYLIGLIGGGAVSGLCAFLPPWLVQGKVSRLAEE